MMIKASGRSALIVATGLFVCFAGVSWTTTATKAATSTSEAATDSKSIKQGSRHWKRSAHRKYSRTEQKSSESKKAVGTDVADAGGAIPPAAIPASVANANALFPDAPSDSAKAMTARANAMLLASADNKPAEAKAPAENQVVAPDQLNDLDRALQETPPPSQTVAMASNSAVKAAAPALASRNDSSTWDQTSLIGKIFIAFGALLTVASAARMFMA